MHGWFLLHMATVAMSAAGSQGAPTSAPAAKAPAACVSRMQITRTVALYDAPDLMPTCFEFELFVNPGRGREVRQYALRLVSLDPIVDDTGKTLLTPERRKENRALHETIPGAALRLVGDTMGPVLPIRLDVPDAAAKRLRQVRGALELSPIEVVKLEFSNLRSLDGRKLEHADLGEADVTVRLDQSDPKSIRLVFKKGRALVRDWAIARGGQPLRASLRSASDPGDPVDEMSYSFDEAIPEDASLWLAVAKPGPPQTCTFDFRDMPLP